jgi:hypothetical protein
MRVGDAAKTHPVLSPVLSSGYRLPGQQPGRAAMLAAMTDWESAVSNLTWLVWNGPQVEVGPTIRWDRPPLADLPQLSLLLAAARVTPVKIGEKQHILLAWDGRGGQPAGWLCLPPLESADGPPVHRQVWRVLGGIVESWNAPDDTWLLNQNAVLTPSLAACDPTAELEAYRGVWEEDGLALPIEPRDYGVLAEEANGNLTLFHRASGDVLLFAPDHAFDHVELLPGCPERTLYRIPDAPTVAAWLECVAVQWLRTICR